MTDISKRLRASVRMNAHNGDAMERDICAKQMLEAAREIELLERERQGSIAITVPERLHGEALETLRSTMQGATVSVAEIVRRLDEAKADAARWRYIRENLKHVPALDDNGQK